MNKKFSTIAKSSLLGLGTLLLTSCSTLTDIIIQKASNNTNQSSKSLNNKEIDIRRLVCKGEWERRRFYPQTNTTKISEKRPFFYGEPWNHGATFDYNSGQLYIKDVVDIQQDDEKLREAADNIRSGKSDNTDYEYIVDKNTGRRIYGSIAELKATLDWVPAKRGVVYAWSNQLEKAKGDRLGYRYQSQINQRGNLIVIRQSVYEGIAYAERKIIFDLNRMTVKGDDNNIIKDHKLNVFNATVHYIGTCKYISPEGKYKNQ